MFYKVVTEKMVESRICTPLHFCISNATQCSIKYYKYILNTIYSCIKYCEYWRLVKNLLVILAKK